MKNARATLISVLALMLSALGAVALAQENYPSRPVRMVWGFSPGGTGEAAVRLLAQRLSAQLNAGFVVENKPGAAGNIGAEFVAKATPDGYTLLATPSGIILSPASGEKLGYDVLKDLTPISPIASSGFLLLTHPAVPVNTAAEFISYVRANPDKLNYGSSGVGGGTHLAGLLFLQANRLTALHVPYKSGPAAVTDLVAGHIQFLMQALSVVPLVKEKRLKALAYTSLKRTPELPDVPTLDESAMPGFEAGNWFGTLAPAKTPPAIVRKLNEEIQRALSDPDVVAKLVQQGQQPFKASPDEFSAYLRSEYDRWSKLLKSAGIRPE